MKVLIAQDGSDIALRAVGWTIDLAARLRETPQVHVVHVHPTTPAGVATRHASPTILDSCCRDEGERALAAARPLLASDGLVGTSHIHVGPVAETIVHVAAELGRDRIRMRTHGRGAASATLPGSAAGKVAHFSPVPVLLARLPDPPSTP
jgi:nucleotide-binding universal stress UspA family protein